MLTALLKRRRRTQEALEAILQTLVEEELAEEGSMREGGRLKLADLGDQVWMEQFR